MNWILVRAGSSKLSERSVQSPFWAVPWVRIWKGRRSAVGAAVGHMVGLSVGRGVGPSVGSGVGRSVGVGHFQR